MYLGKLKKKLCDNLVFNQFNQHFRNAEFSEMLKFRDFVSHLHSTESPRFRFTASCTPYITVYGIKNILKPFHFVKVLEHISLYKLRLIIS